VFVAWSERRLLLRPGGNDNGNAKEEGSQEVDQEEGFKEGDQEEGWQEEKEEVNKR
jgi:hypothetical protein